jgi:phenylacetate-coenzyme A ligase PaaK-like adenylate-forming protein
MSRNIFLQQIFQINSDDSFNELALGIFRYQYQNNAVYHQFVDKLNVKISKVDHYHKIPFLPIDFFKNHQVTTGIEKVAGFFSSSGTTGKLTSRHYYADLDLYEQSSTKSFGLVYGKITDYCILALLPSYLERNDSSLVYMVSDLIKKSGHHDSGFYLDEHQKLAEKLHQLDSSGQKVLLIGVSFALLDFIENHNFILQHAIIIETGGMKGRRREMVREELHQKLSEGFSISEIHSEYGMTELFSQAYSTGSGFFYPPPWMKILIRDVNDPLTLLMNGKAGGINIIDLANLDSCCFIATQDLGKTYKDGPFEVVGRFDNSDVRGCNLMVL